MMVGTLTFDFPASTAKVAMGEGVEDFFFSFNTGD
jgi:hypothetical protein